VGGTDIALPCPTTALRSKAPSALEYFRFMQDSASGTDDPIATAGTGVALGKIGGWTVLCVAAFALLTLAEVRLFDDLLFAKRTDYEFVLTSVDGVLNGTPVSKSWQQRVLAPAAVAALGAITSTRLEALRLFSGVMIVGANALLFALIRRKKGTVGQGLLSVAGFGVGHLLLLYRLEYPWDGIDVLLFLAFGHAARQGRPLRSLGPWLVVGALNHETVLYIPLFYLLAPLERALRADWRKQIGVALLVSILLGATILGMRELFYLGTPDLPAHVFEGATPVIANHLHLEHNVQRFLVANWSAGPTFVTVGLFASLAALIALAAKRRLWVAAAWSLCVAATIFCFGYMNETRHYLCLLAFWFAYGMRGPTSDAAPLTANAAPLGASC
jgi:hypothetical protein